MTYVRLAQTLVGKSDLIPIKDYQTEMTTRFKKSPVDDYYTSLFHFPEEAYDYFKSNNNSISGYPGEVFKKNLFFDLDNKESLENAKKDTVALLHLIASKLSISYNEVLNSVKIWFSGSKGFHIELFTQQSFSNKEMKTIVEQFKDIESLDTGIYDKARLIRIQGTKHQKSGLYKTRLDPEVFSSLTIDEIKDLAKERRISKFKKIDKEVNVKLLLEEIVKKPDLKIVKSKEIEGIKGLDLVDFKKINKGYPRCIYAMLQGIMVPGRGERSRIYLRLATFLRNQGFDREHTHNILKATARKNKQLYPEFEMFDKKELWNTAIKSAYSGDDKFFSKGSWGLDPQSDDGLLFKEYCDCIDKVTDKKCSMHSTVKKTVVTIDEVYDSFQNFAKNISYNRVLTGIDFIDDNMKIIRGTMNLLIGGSGAGKTTLGLNIMENANKMNIYTMFFSLDMNRDSIYLKLAQKHSKYTQDELLELAKSGNQGELTKIRQEVKKHYDKTFFDFSSVLSLEDIKNKILLVEEQNNIKIGFVVIDYASRISGPYSDSYANAKHNALLSKQVADETETALLIFSQISRSTGDGASPLRTKRAAKDAGDWEEAAQNVITMWRPFMGMDGKIDDEGNEFKDNVARVFLAKNRMGREVEAPLHWLPAKGKILTMTPEELDEYSAVIEPLEKKVRSEKFGK